MKVNRYFRWTLINFVVLGIWGVLLRYLQFNSIPGVNYEFILHGHSHFAFSGWMFLALGLLIADSLKENIGRTFNTVFFLTVICSFGMLGTFSMQGYKAVPIIFSTMFILLSYWFSYLVFRNEAFKTKISPLARKLIAAALIYLCLSSLGPFTLGPLMVQGLKQSPLYQNSIYFYLHFQMNGWMVLAALGLFAHHYLKTHMYPRIWLNIFIWSGIPLYFIFTLWSGFNWFLTALAIAGSVLQLLAWIKLCYFYKHEAGKLPFLVKAALLAITLKSVFQVLICFPDLGEWVFMNRNLIIGYVHLITLGSVSPLLLDQFQRRGLWANDTRVPLMNALFLATVVLYLILLFLQPALALWSIALPHFHDLMLGISVTLVLIGTAFLCISLQFRSSTHPEGQNRPQKWLTAHF